MATFNSIHGKTLERVLFYAAGDFSPLYSLSEELLEYFSPAWVCKEWRKILLPKFYEYAFITIISPTSASEHSKVDSNIRLIVENGLSKYAQRLSITVPEGYVTSGHLVELLDGQLFSKTNWPSVNYLKTSGDSHYTSANRMLGESNAYNCDAISQYLHMHLPALSSILDLHKYDSNFIHPLSIFINLKSGQLSFLHTRGPPANFTHHSFSSWLTVLILRLGPDQATLPYIYTPNLRELELLDIPPNFSWRCFHLESSDSFDFSELESMVLRYSTTSTDSMTATPSHSGTHPHAAGLRNIHMPKIKWLSLSHIPPSDAHLFAPHLQSHLDSLDIVGSIDVLTQLGLRFPFSKEVSIRVSDSTVDDIQGYSTLTETIFSSFSAATWVTFEIERYIPISINSIGWSNLKELDILAFISLTTLYRLVFQLPLLERLCVRYITPGDESCQYYKQHSTSPYSPNSSNINCMLQYLECFYSTSHFPLVFNLNPLDEFIAHVVTLKEVVVPQWYLQEVQSHFGQDRIQDYPHIQNIRFGSSNDRFYHPIL